MPEPVAWAYVDDKRTHLVRTSLQRGRTLEFVIEERDPSSKDEAEVYVERHTLVEPWEARVHQMALETRLTLLGNYLKSAGAAWHPLRVPQTGRNLDVKPLDLRDDKRAVEFHHYTSREGGHAVTIVAVHEDLPRGRRSFLARLDYTYPDVNGGNLLVLHPRLPQSVYRSAIASLHLELVDLGFTRVSRDSGLAMDPRSWTALHAVLDAFLKRLIEGRIGKPGQLPGSGQDGDVLQMLEAAQLAKRISGSASASRSFETEDELGPNTTNATGPDVRVRMEELPSDIVSALNEPRLVALHARFLPPGEDARLIAEGELAILRAMREKREAVQPTERHLVSLLEASLLLRYALAKRKRVDPEVINRVRHAGAYL